MKTIKLILPFVAIFFWMSSCTDNKATSTDEGGATITTSEQKTGGQDAVADDDSQKNIVKVAIGSPDHTTLVAALQQADYVDDLSNNGPFTVFAPTNAAFDKLPKGTLDGLMKDDSKADLQNILEYHVAVGVYKTEYLTDGLSIGMANGNNVTISVKDGKIIVNGTATVIATIPAANGIIYVVDAVLLPPAK
jgi:uncharacterized surface protein with fasciclin (FAS1) repeats